MTTRKKLPIGIQTFEKLILGNSTYVDTTSHTSALVRNSGGYFFLSLGKILFLGTLKAAFEGKGEFFQGLSLCGHWDWTQANPAIHISFGSGVMRSIEEQRATRDDILNCTSTPTGAARIWSCISRSGSLSLNSKWSSSAALVWPRRKCRPRAALNSLPDKTSTCWAWNAATGIATSCVSSGSARSEGWPGGPDYALKRGYLSFFQMCVHTW